MLKFEAIKITVITNTGKFGQFITFKNGLNIVRANNTSGKSSLFGAIMYSLGFEELLGGRNEKAMQSVFKSIVKEKQIIDDESVTVENEVIQSSIMLQISNGDRSVTIKRNVIHNSVKPQAIEVYSGSLLTTPDIAYEKQSMYVHDKGAATNSEIGFHMFLEDFIGSRLPEIINQEGRRVKLYLPLIASAHFIEQKSGWSDFFANIPFYGVRDTTTKVFEYILNLSVFETAAKRQEVQNELRIIDEKWKLSRDKLLTAVRRGGGELIGLPELPEILSTEIVPYAKFYRGDKHINLKDLITSLNLELSDLNSTFNRPIGENREIIEQSLQTLREENENYEVYFESLSSEISQDKERYRQYTIELLNVKEDLRKNKDAQKIQELGLEANLKLGLGVCPTCGQSLSDSLLASDIDIVPMRIDENIAYLNAQNQMIEAFVRNIDENIVEKESVLTSIENSIQRNREDIRSIKRDLISDDRLPSTQAIERKVVLERELSFYYKLSEEINEKLTDIYTISKSFEKAKSNQAKLSNTYHSIEDRKKLDFFEQSFKSMITKFGFTSKPVPSINVSVEKYLPVYEIIHNNGLKKFIDIRFESSASDFIRAQWAYYVSLMNTSIQKNGNHFQVLLLDEPQQQSASNAHFKEFLKELEKYQHQQTIVLASFQDSEEDFREAIDGLKSVNIIDLASNAELMIHRISDL